MLIATSPALPARWQSGALRDLLGAWKLNLLPWLSELVVGFYSKERIWTFSTLFRWRFLSWWSSELIWIQACRRNWLEQPTQQTLWINCNITFLARVLWTKFINKSINLIKFLFLRNKEFGVRTFANNYVGAHLSRAGFVKPETVHWLV